MSKKIKLEVKQSILDAKQNVNDSNLQTTAKTIVGAINENKASIDNLSLYIYNITTKATEGQNEGMGIVFELLTTDGNLTFTTFADIFAQYDYVIQTKIVSYKGIGSWGGVADLRSDTLYCGCITQSETTNDLFVHSQNITANTPITYIYTEKVSIPLNVLTNKIGK